MVQSVANILNLLNFNDIYTSQGCNLIINITYDDKATHTKQSAVIRMRCTFTIVCYIQTINNENSLKTSKNENSRHIKNETH